MPGLIGGRRRRIGAAYDALCEAMARADGAAAAAAEAARQDHMLATVELLLRESGLDRAAADPQLRDLLTNPVFAGVVAAMEADRSTGAPRPSEALPKLDRIVAEAAAGPAGEAPGLWLGKARGGSGARDVPRLWRVGVGRLGASGEPFDVAVPLLDEAHLQIVAHPDGRATALGLVENLLLRVVSSFRPGVVRLHLWDVQQITGPLPRLHPLTRSGILTVHDPRGLPALLDELADHVRRVHRRVLGESGWASLAEWVDALGEGPAPERPEPWTVVVLVGDRTALREEERAALGRIARGGLACGVQLVLVDVPITLGARVETVEIDADRRARTSMTGPYGVVEIEPRFAADDVTRACHALAEEHEAWRSRISSLDDLVRTPVPRPSSQHELRAGIGFDDQGVVEAVLDDHSPHALIGGPSGSGKTNLLLTWLAALASRYDPAELELYLLDFKEGVSFAPFAPTGKRPAYLPHARLVGLHVNTDREFGLALLEFLAEQMRDRAAEAKRHGVAKLADLRDADRTGRWPRIVAVIDEFQYLFNEVDRVSRAAGMLLEDVARRGRSQGIHLVLASQDVSGIAAFWGKQAIFEQFVLRIALPRARMVLDKHNEDALALPRWHAVINHESGLKHGNRVARIPDASTRGEIDGIRNRLYLEAKGPRPKVFDGSRTPDFDDVLADRPDSATMQATVGHRIDVDARPAVVALPDVPGRNLAVLGAGAADAVRVLGAAAAGAALRLSPDPTTSATAGASETAGMAGAAEALEIAEAAVSSPWSGSRVVIAGLVDQAAGAVGRLEVRLQRKGIPVTVVGLDGIRETVGSLARAVATRQAGRRAPALPALLVLYGADAAEAVLERPGTEALRTLIRYGPETGLHVLGWWRSVPRLRSLLMMGASADDIGAWVALDVQGAELQPLLPGTLLTWAPRPGRGLFLDRAQHSVPEVVVVPGEDLHERG